MYNCVDDQFDEPCNYEYCEDTALADPNVMNTFPIRAPALSAILLGDFWSKRFIM
jgi:hypothetical protein